MPDRTYIVGSVRIVVNAFDGEYMEEKLLLVIENDNNNGSENANATENIRLEQRDATHVNSVRIVGMLSTAMLM